jgi:hypothetical protein
MARVMPLKNFVLNAVMGITAYFLKAMMQFMLNTGINSK